MSEYYGKLDAVAQSRYFKKLKLLDLEEKNDLSYCSYTTKGVHVHIINLLGRKTDLHDRLLRSCMHNSTVHYLIYIVHCRFLNVV